MASTQTVIGSDAFSVFYDYIHGKLVQPAYVINESTIDFSLTASGSSLTPITNRLYLALNGTYINQLFRYDGSAYVEVSAGTVNNYTLAYIVSGSTAYSSGWLSETSGGTALTPSEDIIYVVATSGDYENKTYRYNGSNYVEISPDTDTNYVLSYIVGTTAMASDWLSETASGTAFTPDEDKLYIIATAGNYQNKIYRYDGSTYIEVGVPASYDTHYSIAYIISGATALSSTWLTDTNGSTTALTPNTNRLYFIATSGEYEGRVYRYNGTSYEEFDGTHYILAYIVSGSTALSSTWLSVTSGGTALTPETDKLYVIATSGDYENFVYRYNGSSYVLVGKDTDTHYKMAYIISGSTAFGSSWLSETDGGTAALTPDSSTLYVIGTNGMYLNKIYRYDSTNTTYVELGRTNYQISYVVSGSTALATGWLSDSANGSALTPDTETLYLIVTSGSYLNRIYRWTGTEYVEVSAASGSVSYAYIISGATALTSGWLTDIEGSTTALAPSEGILYIILTSGTYYDFIYRWDNTNSTYVCVSTPNNVATIMTGATETTAGTSGTVPAPAAGEQNKVLLGSGVWSNVPQMTGATAYADGKTGGVPAPSAGDASKVLYGDGAWRPIYTGSSTYGSTVRVTTSISELEGQTVTLTDGYTTLTGTISSGECIFTNVDMFGTVSATATDTSSNLATGSVTLSYYGYYILTLTEDYATITVSTSDTALYGQTLNVYYNDTAITTVTLNASGTVTFYVEETGVYKLKATVGGKLVYAKITVSALYTTYTKTVQLAEVYAFYIDKTDSDPTTCVHEYTDCEYGCLNEGYTPAYTYQDDSTASNYGQLVYGSWTGNEFFFPKPCMLKYDGTVDYYLNKNNYAYKEDGTTASDYNDLSYGGNAMMEFPTVYFQRTTSGDYDYVVISDIQLDSSFHAYAHHDIAGEVLPNIYLAIYNSSYDGTRFRSISGIQNASSSSGLCSGYLAHNTTMDNEIFYAAANNPGGLSCEGWTIQHAADRDMVNDLLILLTMRLDTDASIGRGMDAPGNNILLTTGYGDTSRTISMDEKGLFYGISSDGNHGVKVFGMENWWGNLWRRELGWAYISGTQYRKMTYGTEDGSTVNGFNTSGSGYVQISNSTMSGSNGGYISSWKYSEMGMIPITASGSSSTYLCDGIYYSNSGTRLAFCGGDSGSGVLCGAFCSDLADGSSKSGWYLCAALSYKNAV